MTSPDQGSLVYGRMAGIAAKHAPAWRPGGQSEA